MHTMQKARGNGRKGKKKLGIRRNSSRLLPHQEFPHFSHSAGAEVPLRSDSDQRSLFDLVSDERCFDSQMLIPWNSCI